MSLFGGDLDLALAAARNGEERGFAELWQGLQPAVLRYLRAVVGSAADEVASQTWQEAAREVRQFRGDATGFRVWLFRVARYRAMAEVRRAGNRREGQYGGSGTGSAWHAADGHGSEWQGAERQGSDGGSAGPGTGIGFGGGNESGGGPGTGPVPGLAGPAATDRALRLMARLPRDESEAVLLRVVAGLDVAQAAMVLGVRDEAARTAAARGLRKLALIADETARVGAADGDDGRRRTWSSE